MRSRGTRLGYFFVRGSMSANVNLANLTAEERLVAEFSSLVFNALGDGWAVYMEGEAVSETCGDLPKLVWRARSPIPDAVGVSLVTQSGRTLGRMDVSSEEVADMVATQPREYGRFPIAYWFWGITQGAGRLWSTFLVRKALSRRQKLSCRTDYRNRVE